MMARSSVLPPRRHAAHTLLFLLAACFYQGQPTTGIPAHVQWEEWSDAIFQRAEREDRLVLLHLGAVWCHWCHVMEETTYRDPKVISLLSQSFIAVRVDQDARPDLASRYGDYGWPATILFNKKGEEIAKLKGYLPAPRMIATLEAFIEDPTPGPSVLPEAEIQYGSATTLTPALRMELLGLFREGYDPEHKGWGRVHKFLDGELVEYAMRLASAKDASAEAMARETLAAQRALFDPVWGGVYQYSDSGVWENPHYEKIMFIQADNILSYVAAYLLFGDPEYLSAAREVHRYLRDFLKSPEGAFYTSQDADVIKGEHSEEYFALDDAGRRARGIPAVDKNRYSRENGWAISALAALFSATGEASFLEEAVTAARWVEKHRALPGGGFSHGEKDEAGPFLDDQLAMGQAFLQLYMVSAEPEWLKKAAACADFIQEHFTSPGEDAAPGFVQARPTGGPRATAPRPTVKENVAVARFANLLYHYTQAPRYRRMAEHALRYLVTPKVAKSRPGASAGILLADEEFSRDPVRITILGPKDDPEAKALFEMALRYPSSYKRVDWWDSREGPAPAPDVFGVKSSRASAVVCVGERCSAPLFDPAKIRAEGERLWAEGKAEDEKQ